MLKAGIIFSTLVLFVWGSAFSQHPVSGVILNDESGEPIPFVSVAVIGKPIGTVSNQNGVFKLSTSAIKEEDSVGFFYIGFEKLILSSGELSGEMTIRLKEQPIEMEEISVTARRMSGRELIRLALENREQNYSIALQHRTIFKRNNSATWIDRFDLELEKSNLEEIDEEFVQTLEDRMVRYTRSYTDYLYHLYNSPRYSAPSDGKIRGIKRISLYEETGGEMEQIERQINELIVEQSSDEFWKLKIGPVSAKLSEPGDDAAADEPPAPSEDIRSRYDSINSMVSKRLYAIDSMAWEYDFLQKPARYRYDAQGIISIQGERCYVVHFKGHPRQDFTGKIYISEVNYAILRIEYDLKERKAENEFRLLGFSQNESENSGLIIYEPDQGSYHLKYHMRSKSETFSLDRPFQLIKKVDRPVFNKRVNKIDFKLAMYGRSNQVNEVLILDRKPLDRETFDDIVPKWIKTETISSYTDELWEGYTILEPTRQMKEYRRSGKTR